MEHRSWRDTLLFRLFGEARHAMYFFLRWLTKSRTRFDGIENKGCDRFPSLPQLHEDSYLINLRDYLLLRAYMLRNWHNKTQSCFNERYSSRKKWKPSSSTWKLHGEKKKEATTTNTSAPPTPPWQKKSHQLRSTELFTNHICRKPTNHRAEFYNQKSCHPMKNGCKQRCRQLKYCNHYCNHNQPLHEKQCLILIILRCND